MGLTECLRTHGPTGSETCPNSLCKMNNSTGGACVPTMGEGAGDQITILIYQERVLALNMKYGALEQLALINVTSSALNNNVLQHC